MPIRVCMCVHICMCVHAHFCRCSRTCVQARDNLGSRSSGTPHLLLLQGPPVAWDSLSRSGWPASEPQESTCFRLSCAGSISILHHSWLKGEKSVFWDLTSVCKHVNVTPRPRISCLRRDQLSLYVMFSTNPGIFYFSLFGSIGVDPGPHTC